MYSNAAFVELIIEIWLAAYLNISSARPAPPPPPGPPAINQKSVFRALRGSTKS